MKIFVLLLVMDMREHYLFDKIVLLLYICLSAQPIPLFSAHGSLLIAFQFERLDFYLLFALICDIINTCKNINIQTGGTIMSKILVVSGHTNYDHSLANRTILENLKELGPDFTLHRLDQLGWEFDVEKEQELLKEADVIVFQFPIHWYSYPALMKNWVEVVFAHGFAYGSNGTALKGKKFQISFTTGSPASAYTPEGGNKHNIEDFLYNFQQLAALCGMEYEEPIITFGAAFIPGVSPDFVKERILADCKAHAQKLSDRLKSF